jgi:hypothetical protein
MIQCIITLLFLNIVSTSLLLVNIGTKKDVFILIATGSSFVQLIACIAILIYFRKIDLKNDSDKQSNNENDIDEAIITDNEHYPMDDMSQQQVYYPQETHYYPQETHYYPQESYYNPQETSYNSNVYYSNVSSASVTPYLQPVYISSNN